MGKPIIEFKEVYKEYGGEENKFYAVKNISFTIEKGEFVVILGQSGAGKSTMLNMLGGMDKPTMGSIVVCGEEISSFNDKQQSDYRARRIGFIFQFYNLLTGLTALENISIAKEIVDDPIDADELIEAVGLKEKKKAFPSQMSGGEQQRVSIARALAKNPEIILGDEPTGALDSDTGKNILDTILKISREKGKTVVIVTHNSDIAKCANKVIRMKNGEITKIEINESPLPVEGVEW